MERLVDFLMFGLPSGFVATLITWLANRRQRDNDMLSKLQASINLLSDENSKILAENVQLRRENANLQANQEQMLIELASLRLEVEHLRKEINKQSTNNENNNQRGAVPRNNGNYSRGSYGMRGSKAAIGNAGSGCRLPAKYAHGQRGNAGYGDAVSDELDTAVAGERDVLPVLAGNPAGGGEPGAGDDRPP